MYNDICGFCAHYTLETDGDTLIVSFEGGSENNLLEAWSKMKSELKAQLQFASKRVEHVRFRGDLFGKRLFSMIRYEFRDFLDWKCEKEYELGVTTMRLFYIEKSIFCFSRYDYEFKDELRIEIDAPADTKIRFRKEKEEVEFAAKIENGIATIPEKFLTDGDYLVYAAKDGELPTNVIKMTVSSGKFGKHIRCGEEDMHDAIYTLMKAYYNTDKKVSAHVDGYEVI